MKPVEFKYSPPGAPFALFNDPLQELLKFYKEHIRRDVDGVRLKPAESWVLLRGLLISAEQTYKAICILLSEKQPKRLMLQASILTRSLLETLGNVMAICEAPKSRTRSLIRDSFKNLVKQFQSARAKPFRHAKWLEYLDIYAQNLSILAKELRISRRYIKAPDLIKEEWPTPGKILYGDNRRKIPPMLGGSRRAAFETLYLYHYGRQSEQAHQRAAAVSAALVVDDPSSQWNPGFGESVLISDALLFIACILTELEVEGRYPPHPRLKELWIYLRELNLEASELWGIRYQALLK